MTTAEQIAAAITAGLITAEEVSALSSVKSRVNAEWAALVALLGDNARAIVIEERRRIRDAGCSTWEEYRALSRAGSRYPLGGRAKKAVWAWLDYADTPRRR